MLDEAGGAVREGAAEAHGQAGTAEGQTVWGESPAALVVAALGDEGDSRHAVGGVRIAARIGVNVPSIESRVERAEKRRVAEMVLRFISRGIRA